MFKLIKKLLEPFTFRQAASFEFSGSIDEGVRLLSANVKYTWYPTFQEFLMGKVSDAKVSVWHYRPLKRQLVTAVFTGCFTSENNKTILTGEFAMHKWQKIVYELMIIPILLVTSILAMALRQTVHPPLPVYSILFVPYIIMLVTIHRNYGNVKDDINYIENKFTEILRRPKHLTTGSTATGNSQ